ncbi:MAG: hypothetical protein D4R73_03600 [Deltaproteobacteria bacterium]|nr:MAG: hypothetical protein D4R73_03600 [Deltaproteobacteria bacterium]
MEFYEDTPYPVDYKHGPRRRREHDDLQVCAQGMYTDIVGGLKREIRLEGPVSAEFEKAIWS